jgi:hypothetical protein
MIVVFIQQLSNFAYPYSTPYPITSGWLLSDHKNTIMKTSAYFLSAMLCIMVSIPALSQKYKTAADTVKLNKDYVAVSNDIADLTARLAIAENNLPGYHAKAAKAVTDAEASASESRNQAAKATNGDLADAKKAKKKAGAALDDAKDLRSANNHTKDQNKKIAGLRSRLSDKQEKLRELETMRSAIRNIR